MQILSDIMSRVGITVADGRPLHAYVATQEELASLQRLLPLRLNAEQRLGFTAQAFVLWACEHIRTVYPGGQLTWEFVFQGIGIKRPDYSYITWLVETGLHGWKRRLLHSASGHREFLYTLLSEGGLPDAALAEAGRYTAVLLRLITEFEAEGALAAVTAAMAAHRHLDGLPQTLRTDEQARLLADLALGLVTLRAALPKSLPAEAAAPWLDAHRPEWRSTLPLRMSSCALEVVVWPALFAAQPSARTTQAAVQRELRKKPGRDLARRGADRRTRSCPRLALFRKQSVPPASGGRFGSRFSRPVRTRRLASDPHSRIRSARTDS